MIMHKEFINHNNNVDFLRYQEHKEHIKNSFDRYYEKLQRIEEENYSAASWR